MVLIQMKFKLVQDQLPRHVYIWIKEIFVLIIIIIIIFYFIVSTKSKIDSNKAENKTKDQKIKRSTSVNSNENKNAHSVNFLKSIKTNRKFKFMFHIIKRSSSRQSAGPDIDDDDQNKVERIFLFQIWIFF